MGQPLEWMETIEDVRQHFWIPEVCRDRRKEQGIRNRQKRHMGRQRII